MNKLIAPTPGWTLVTAQAINGSGDIVGIGGPVNGGAEAYLSYYLAPK